MIFIITSLLVLTYQTTTRSVLLEVSKTIDYFDILAIAKMTNLM